jgi:hypothetical protein
LHEKIRRLTHTAGQQSISDKLHQHIPGLNPVTLGHLDGSDHAQERRGDVDGFAQLKLISRKALLPWK